MAETVVTAPKVVASYKTKVDQPREKQYENSEAMFSVEVQFDTPTPTNEEIVAAGRDAFALAKALVFDELQIEHTVDPRTGVVVEAMRKELGAAVVHEAPAGDPKETAWLRLDKEIRENQLPLKEDGSYQLPSFEDNRFSKSGRQPDFKTKKGVKSLTSVGVRDGFGLWLDSAPEWFDKDQLSKEVM